MNSSGRVIPYLFILFSDVLLYGDSTSCHQVIHLSVCQIIDSQSGDDNASIGEDESRGSSGADSPSGLTTAKKAHLKNSFTIRSPRKEFVVLASNAQQKTLWLNTLAKTVGECRRATQDMIQQRSQLSDTDEAKDRSESCRLCLRPFSALRRRKVSRTSCLCFNECEALFNHNRIDARFANTMCALTASLERLKRWIL